MSVPRFANAFRGMIRGDQTPELCAAACFGFLAAYVSGCAQGAIEAVTERPFTPIADAKAYLSKLNIEFKKP